MPRFWNHCPSGVIDGMIRRRADHRRLRSVLFAVLISLLISAGTMASYYKPGVTAPESQLDFITCQQFEAWIGDFMLCQLPGGQDAQMCAHIARCRQCRQAYYPRTLRYSEAFCR